MTSVPYYGFHGVNKTALAVGADTFSVGKNGRLKYVSIKDTQEIAEGTFVQLQIQLASGNFPLLNAYLGGGYYQVADLDIPVVAGQQFVLTYVGISTTYLEVQWVIE